MSAPVSAAAPAAEDTIDSLRESIQRCQDLLSRHSLVSRMPDQGKGLKARLAEQTAKLAELRRDRPEATTPGPASGPPEVAEPPTTATEAAPSAAVRTLQQEQWQFAEKHRHDRVDAVAELTRMFAGLLSDKEIARRVQELPATPYFLTLDESEKVSKALRREERARELAQMKAAAVKLRSSLGETENNILNPV